MNDVSNSGDKPSILPKMISVGTEKIIELALLNERLQKQVTALGGPYIEAGSPECDETSLPLEPSLCDKIEEFLINFEINIRRLRGSVDRLNGLV